MYKLQQNHVLYFSRFALFFDYFAFGILKIVDRSPATALVEALHSQTISFIPFGVFLIFLGISECLIGISLLIPKLTKYAVPVMIGHMFTTMLPLILLPDITWDGFLVPTLTGQYIMKNIVLIALALNILMQCYQKPTR